jgi:hypothetical protein
MFLEISFSFALIKLLFLNFKNFIDQCRVERAMAKITQEARNNHRSFGEKV